MKKYTVAANLDNASSDPIIVTHSGVYMFSVESDTWGGGGAILQKKSGNGKWVPVSGTYATTDTCVNEVHLSAGEYRVNAVTAINVFAYLTSVMITDR